MKDVVDCIKTYAEIAEEDGFILHWKELSERLIKGIQNSYSYREESIVKIVEHVINSVGTFGRQGDKRKFSIFTNSIFIHGNKSQVKFNYYGKSTQRELGDIIFILSVVYNGKKYFERLTINQVKKPKNTSWKFSSESAKEQVYLLSRFPTFEGVERSLIPQTRYSLPNNSGCLGTHGLLYPPGDFALVSSKELEVILLNKSTLKIDDLLRLKKETMQDTMCLSCLICDCDFEICVYILRKLIHYFPKFHTCFQLTCNLPLLKNDCISYNSYDFTKKYLMGHIGELIYAKGLPYNRPAFQFLQALFNSIRKKAEKEQLKKVLEFIKSFYQYKYSDSNSYKEYDDNYGEGGGIGIVHTTVNLGEG